MATTMQTQQPSLRMSMAMARTAHRASEWQFGKAEYAPSWHAGNKHTIIMSKSKPPAPPEPKEPVPTLADLKIRHEDKLRCFNPSLHQELAMAAAPERQPGLLGTTSKSGQEASGSIASRTSKSLLTRSRMDETIRSAEAGMTLGPPMDKLSASVRKKEVLEQRHKEENERRLALLHESVQKKQMEKEEQFENMYKTLKEEKESFVKDLCHYLDNKQRAQDQKRKALHTEWTECVFNKIQDQLLDRLDNLDEAEIQAKRRQLFQNYIDASARKGGGLFLDIVIENEYDPFTWKKDTLKYRAKPAVVSNGPGFTDRFGNPVHDPVKRDLEKLKAEATAARSVGGGPSFGAFGDGKLGRETLGHEHWSKMEATPYFDRAAKVQDAIASGKTPVVRKGTKTTLEIDDFRYPVGPDVVSKECHGLYGRGKKVWKDWQPGASLAVGGGGGGGGGGGADH